ncbi:DUF1073 domain-containing protein [Lichenibacterium minor]|uniref:DUF1073 domain-containing protein n=1 Tax=Lichenibacterium minor TaxID=2316528 RepID=A0A4Q2U9C0_9HYPH|nr:DUF1073 domain-containing protein [Lichenibacterium minor]
MGLADLHAASRWQLGVSELDLNPLSPWCGEPKSYTLSSPGLAPLELHPSRVVRFLGNPLPDRARRARCGRTPSCSPCTTPSTPRRCAGRGDEPAARGEGRRGHGAEPLRAPEFGRDHRAALRPLRLQE